VAAASDLKFAFDEIAARLEGEGLAVEPTYGSSGNFHAQIRHRAPFDMFLSADVEYPRDLVSQGIGGADDLFTYATGRLVVWVPAGSTLPVERDGLGALAHATRIAIANPRHAPYGRAAERALEAAGLIEALGPRLVLGDSVVQAAQFAQTGAADAGLIAKSLAVAPSMQQAGRHVDVPAGTYPPLLQGGLILPWTASRDAAERVRDFLLSAEGRGILRTYGFEPAGPDAAAPPD
jgi:molybdate transport system substrate-binding protein